MLIQNFITKSSLLTKYAASLLMRKTFCGPYIASLNTYDKCNTGCVFCPVYKHPKEGSISDNGVMKFQTFKHIIHDLKQMGTNVIMFSGSGEPFLHPDAWQMIHHIQKEGLICYIATNGILLGKAEMRMLVRLGVSHLSVSMHAGTEETYTSVHKEKNEKMFRLVKRNLEFLKDYKTSKGINTPKLSILNVICNKNCYEIQDMIHLAAQFNGRPIFKPLIRWNLPKYLPDFDRLELSETQKKKIVKESGRYMALAKELGQTTNIPLFIKQIQGLMSPARCYAGFLATHIKTNGNVVPCWNATRSFGNVQKQAFHEIWFSEAYKEFRKNSTSIDKIIGGGMDCKKCAFAVIDKSYYQKLPSLDGLLHHLLE